MGENKLKQRSQEGFFSFAWHEHLRVCESIPSVVLLCQPYQPVFTTSSSDVSLGTATLTALRIGKEAGTMVGKEDKVKTTALKTTRPHQRPDLLRHIALLCLCGPFLLSTTYAFVGPQVSGSRQTLKLFETVDENGNTTTTTAASVEVTRPKRIRSLVKDVAKMVVPRPLISSAYAQPDAIAEVIKEAAFLAVDEALQLRGSSAKGPKATISNHDEVSEDGGTSNIATLLLDEEGMEALIAEAFDPLEQSLDNLEESLHQARNSMAAAKEAVRAVHAAAREQVQDAVTAARLAQEVASREAVAEMYAAVNDVDVESLTYDDVDFAASQMTPPFLGDDQCLVPGEPIVRVEKAPQNSRRIFAGIDILASVDTVWEVLTDYSNLQNVVPNLAVNTVAQTFESKNAAEMLVDEFRPELEQCQELSCLLKGAVLKQVGKVRYLGSSDDSLCFVSCFFYGTVSN